MAGLKPGFYKKIRNSCLVDHAAQGGERLAGE